MQFSGVIPRRVRPERPDDGPGIRAVHEAAFGRADEADLVAALRHSEAWLPGLCFVAESAGQVIGHIVLSRLTVGGGDALALAPLAVLPSAQRGGIGTALTLAALTAAGEAGERLVVVVGDPGY